MLSCISTTVGATRSAVYALAARLALSSMTWFELLARSATKPSMITRKLVFFVWKRAFMLLNAAHVDWCRVIVNLEENSVVFCTASTPESTSTSVLASLLVEL